MVLRKVSNEVRRGEVGDRASRSLVGDTRGKVGSGVFAALPFAGISNVGTGGALLCSIVSGLS